MSVQHFLRTALVGAAGAAAVLIAGAAAAGSVFAQQQPPTPIPYIIPSLTPVPPGSTATPIPDAAKFVIVTGTVDFSTGEIVVNGYIIAPASAFTPSILSQGDLVIITGYLLPDGITIQAESLELFFEPSATPTFVPTVFPTATAFPTATLVPGATATPAPTLTLTPTFVPTLLPTATATFAATENACGRPDHPVALRIAEAFGVAYDVVIGQHCAGFGFGEITRAYLLSQQTSVSAQTYLDMKAAGMGWGQIRQQAGVDPASLAPGQVLRQGGGNGNGGNPNADAGGNGNGNGNGRGNGNNCPGNSCNAPGHNGGGNGNGNGNGNGRGNGNGNGGGNGNGRGNGGG